MKWFHRCDLDWLKARQKILTATDVKELLPFTKTGRTRTIKDEHYIKVFARKLVHITDADCVSTGVMARGHVLEPYAIEMYNKEIAPANGKPLVHWDDIVINNSQASMGLGFSPDACDIEPPCDGAMMKAEPKYIGEVKCYSAENHMICGYSDKMDLEERWQVAAAMASAPSIDEAFLLFYNPSMRNQLYVTSYTRDDLDNEIQACLNAEKEWLSFLGRIGTLDRLQLISGSVNAEQEIVDQIIKSEELNPEGEKSVVR